jgi:hypothetical protein
LFSRHRMSSISTVDLLGVAFSRTFSMSTCVGLQAVGPPGLEADLLPEQRFPEFSLCLNPEGLCVC